MIGLTFGDNLIYKSTARFFDIGPYFKRTMFFAIQSRLIAHMHNVYLSAGKLTKRPLRNAVSAEMSKIHSNKSENTKINQSFS